jgi:hypothetical protein
MVMLTGIAGEWRQGENLHQYRADSGAVLNWWKSTGTVTFQGPEAAAANLKTAFLKFSGRLKGEALEEGWIYKRSRSKENWIIFFYKDWEIAGISNKETRQKKWLVKCQRLRFLRFNRRPHPGPHYPSEQRRLQRPS